MCWRALTSHSGFVMTVVLLLALLTVGGCDSGRVKGHADQDVTLPCKYDRKYHGALSACWQRGEIPNSGCYNPLISTDGDKVLTRASSRFQLLGRLEDGDVSLTIKSLTDRDAGRYGCRVEIPGWFNDDKHHIDLSVDTAPQTPTWRTSNAETPTEPTAASEGHMTSVERLLTSPSTMTSSRESEDSSQLTVVVVCVLLGLVSLLAIVGLLLARRLKLCNTMPQQHRQVSGSVRFNPTSWTLQLHSQPAAVDNIYQMDGSEGGVYENCP